MLLIFFLAHRDTILPWAIKTLQGAGYKLVTVAECLGMDPYQNGIASVPEPVENVGLRRPS